MLFISPSRGDCDAENCNIHGKNIVSLTHQSRAGEVKKMEGVISFGLLKAIKGVFLAALGFVKGADCKTWSASIIIPTNRASTSPG